LSHLILTLQEWDLYGQSLLFGLIARGSHNTILKILGSLFLEVSSSANEMLFPDINYDNCNRSRENELICMEP